MRSPSTDSSSPSFVQQFASSYKVGRQHSRLGHMTRRSSLIEAQDMNSTLNSTFWTEGLKTRSHDLISMEVSILSASSPRILNIPTVFVFHPIIVVEMRIVGLRQLHLCVGQPEHYYSEHMTTNDWRPVMSSDVMSLRHPGIPCLRCTSQPLWHCLYH